MSASLAVEPARPMPAALPVPRKAASPGLAALRLFLRNPSGIVGLAILLALVFAALAGPSLLRGRSLRDRRRAVPASGGDPLLGTDYLGQDILAGLLQGGRATLLVGLSSALMTVVIGVTFGALSGFFGGAVDAGLMKLTEFFQVAADAALRDGTRHPVRPEDRGDDHRHRHRPPGRRLHASLVQSSCACAASTS
ncbi:hypothetical protein ACU4GR_12660 [Methylobacterium oryzae CBMB20]